jgi:hypothetical protein
MDCPKVEHQSVSIIPIPLPIGVVMLQDVPRVPFVLVPVYPPLRLHDPISSSFRAVTNSTGTGFRQLEHLHFGHSAQIGRIPSIGMQ